MPSRKLAGPLDCLKRLLDKGYEFKMKTDFLDKILLGDVRELGPQLPEQSIHAVVTSPPYFGHRNYSEGKDSNEIGRETRVEDYVSHLVDCFESIKGCLRDDGTLWLNLGDTYRDKQLLGVPWRVALALKDAGWYLRSDIIWHKPNAMPSSVKDRPTVDHEYLFLFSKGASYHYDADAIREPHVTFSPNSRMRGGRNHLGKKNGTPEKGKNGGSSNLHDGRWDQYFHPLGRNKRTVWTVTLGKFREAHFAVFPEGLIEPCIKAGSPPDGVVLDPFMGAGTTALVSKRLGRHFVGFDLVSKYVDLATQRVAAALPPTLTLLDEIETSPTRT